MITTDNSHELLKLSWRREIGAKIKEARIARNLSQAELASLVGLDQPHVARIESGQYNFTVGTLGLICSAMGMTISIESPK